MSHFQKAVMKVGDFLIFLAIGLSLLLTITQLWRGVTPVELVQFVLILVVASIPVAMPAVLSVTMALGALVLSRMKAIVSRLQAIEEMAGIDILCTDKTGTLTKNQLTLGDPIPFKAKDGAELILAAALASEEETQDAIDQAVMGALKNKDDLKAYSQVAYTPFDPINKRTESTMKTKEGKTFYFTKGAPQVIQELSNLDAEDRQKAQKAVDELAAKGYRTIGVARAGDDRQWISWAYCPCTTRRETTPRRPSRRPRPTGCK